MLTPALAYQADTNTKPIHHLLAQQLARLVTNFRAQEEVTSLACRADTKHISTRVTAFSCKFPFQPSMQISALVAFYVLWKVTVWDEGNYEKGTQEIKG